jgi:hypothetical protein
MSKFYGQVNGGRGTATRCGHSRIKASVQSHRGSVITELTYKDDQLMVEVRVGVESTYYGSLIFYGTYEEFVSKLIG